MTPNFLIRHFKLGKLVEERSIHNSWAERGREWLSWIVALQAPSASYEQRRIKYMSLGMGSINRSGLVLVPPLSTSHSTGEDPRGTAGNTYRDDNLTGSSDGVIPDVSTLEMPARVTGTSSPPDDYPDAITNEDDTWYIEDPNLYTSVIGETVSGDYICKGLGIHAFVDCTAGDYIYPVGTPHFSQVPISEAGLHLDDIETTKPYEALVAYVNFGTILLDAESQLEIIWQVRFAS